MSTKTARNGGKKADPCRILIVDDHPILRDGLTRLIQFEEDLTVCGQAETSGGALQQLDKLKPDVAVVDIFLPGSANGIELTKMAASLHPDVKVVILSMHDDAIYVERALRAGARGYVTKQEVSSVILDAIRTVRDGGKYISRCVAPPTGASPCAPTKAKPRRGIDALSDRELEVLELLGNSCSRADIAQQLGLSVKTVEAHRGNIREKLGIKTSLELAHYAVRWVERQPGRKTGK